MGELFLVRLVCDVRCDKKNGVKNATIFVEKVLCFNVEQIDNGC